MWLPTVEALLCETAQAGPGVQFSAAITFCFLSGLCIFAVLSFSSTSYIDTLYSSEKEMILALFS